MNKKFNKKQYLQMIKQLSADELAIALVREAELRFLAEAKLIECAKLIEALSAIIHKQPDSFGEVPPDGG